MKSIGTCPIASALDTHFATSFAVCVMFTFVLTLKAGISETILILHKQKLLWLYQLSHSQLKHVAMHNR